MSFVDAQNTNTSPAYSGVSQSLTVSPHFAPPSAGAGSSAHRQIIIGVVIAVLVGFAYAFLKKRAR